MTSRDLDLDDFEVLRRAHRVLGRRLDATGVRLESSRNPRVELLARGEHAHRVGGQGGRQPRDVLEGHRDDPGHEPRLQAEPRRPRRVDRRHANVESALLGVGDRSDVARREPRRRVVLGVARGGPRTPRSTPPTTPPRSRGRGRPRSRPRGSRRPRDRGVGPGQWWA